MFARDAPEPPLLDIQPLHAMSAIPKAAQHIKVALAVGETPQF